MKRRALAFLPAIGGLDDKDGAAARKSNARAKGIRQFLIPLIRSRPVVAAFIFIFICNVLRLNGRKLIRKCRRRLMGISFVGPFGLPRTPDAPSYQSYLECLEDPQCTRFPKRNNTLLSDYPGHPWHWARENRPDPVLSKKKDCNGQLYIDLYHQFHEHGYVVFESCSLKHSNLLEKVKKYTKSLKRVSRKQNAPNQAVKELSTDKDTMELLAYLHSGRKAFPFQTLNFAKGTQQPLHSDLLHFDTSPRTLMSAAWVALEDVNPWNGPLQYVPGSHLFGTWDYDEVGMYDKHKLPYKYIPKEQDTYGQLLARLTKEAGLKVQRADSIKEGQTFIWAAALVHGGSGIEDQKQTRYSQVTHYFFEGADFYWHPLDSDLARGKIKYLGDSESVVFHRCSNPDYAPYKLHSCADSKIRYWMDSENWEDLPAS